MKKGPARWFQSVPFSPSLQGQCNFHAPITFLINTELFNNEPAKAPAMPSTKVYLLPLFVLVCLALSCTKNDTVQNPASTLTYGDSVFYVTDQSSDLLVRPVHTTDGNYSSFPEGLELDPSTGVINVTRSEAGMRYRITFRSAQGDTSNAFVVISGINFPDKYYRLANADSVAFPVYNADASRAIPPGIFDEDRIANNSGCAMRTNNGQINLKESIRNGLFGSTPKNDTRKDFEVKYRLDDKSGKALNKIKILLYYYDTMADVPADLQQTVREHQAMTFQPDNTPVLNMPIASIAAKPRPPCIIVIGH
jgi:hypothetical protein